MKIISINALNKIEEIEKLCKDSNDPIFIEQDGDIRFVIFDFDYNIDLIYKLNEAKLVNEGLEDLKSGKAIDGQKVKDKINKKY